MGDALPARGTDLSVVAIGRVGIWVKWALSAIVARTTVSTSPVLADVA
uniref:Uncharacterized protein n=1 Tax=uncultured myxobacterium HF0200_19H16 TaxID=723559 RepID=E7C3W4_9BACT|nr:hypothetical protein [uncultured myxobacterium HF0200_19H16]